MSNENLSIVAMIIEGNRLFNKSKFEEAAKQPKCIKEQFVGLGKDC